MQLPMKGWKTWLGIALYGAGSVLKILEQTGVIPPGSGTMAAELLVNVGVMIGAVGLGAKADKASK